MKFYPCILLIITLVATYNLQGQSFNELVTGYHDFTASNPVETIQLHTDRDLYLAGETILFSINGYAGNRGGDGHLSDIICIELINGRNEIVQQKRIAASGLKTSGQIKLQPEYESGYYTIQAYTLWDENFGPCTMATKYIKVINAFYPRAVTSMGNGFMNKTWYDIELFPSCKDLINGVENKVVVKAFNKYLWPQPGKGLISSDKYDSVASVFIDSTGLGSFFLNPEPGEKYYFHYLSDKFDTVHIPLPNAVEGILIVPDQEDGTLRLDFSMSPGFSPKNQLNLLITKSYHIVYHYENIDISDKKPHHVPGKLAPGMYFIYLVEDDLEIISRRNIIIPAALQEVKIGLNRSHFAAREKVILEINPQLQSPDQTVYDITVMKDLGILAKNSNSCWTESISSMPLPPDWMNVPGPDSSHFLPVLDNLAATLSPAVPLRKLNDIYQSEITIPPEYGGEIMAGQVINRNDNSPARDEVVALSLNGEGVQFYNTLTNHVGDFRFYLKDIYNNQQITLTCIPPDNSKSITIDDHFVGTMSADTLPPLLPDEKYRQDIENLFRSAQIQREYPESLQKDKAGPNRMLNNFYGDADFILEMDEYILLPVMEEVFFELVGNVMVSKSKGKTRLHVIDENTQRVIGDSPLMLIDGIPCPDTGPVMSLNPENVKSIRVVHHKYYLGMLSFDGIIDIRTRETYNGNPDLPPGAIHMEYPFAEKPQQPLFRDYSTGVPDRIPDFRNVLYWAPGVSDENEVTFYTSDETGRYRITVREIKDGQVTGTGTEVIVVE